MEPQEQLHTQTRLVKSSGRIFRVALDDPGGSIDLTSFDFTDVLKPEFWRDCAELQNGDRINVIGPGGSFDVALDVTGVTPAGPDLRVVVQAPLEAIMRDKPSLRLIADADVNFAQISGPNFICFELGVFRQRLEPGAIVEIESAAFLFAGEALVAGFDDDIGTVNFYWLSIRDFSQVEDCRPVQESASHGVVLNGIAAE